MESHNKPVTIKIRSLKYDCSELPGAEQVKIDKLVEYTPTEIIEDTVEGQLRADTNRIIVVYNETEASGMAGTRSMISFDPRDSQSLKIIRSGTVKSNFDFQEGKTSSSRYTTSFFNFDMKVHTVTVDNNLTENGGRLMLDYVMEIPYSMKDRMLLTLDVKEKEDEYPII